MAWIAGIALVLIIGACAYFRLSWKIWLPLLLFVLLGYSYFHLISLPLLIIGWIALISSGAVLILSPWRRKFIIVPFSQWFLKQQPPLTQAEQTVLEAGGIWWEREFFTGSPDWKKLMSLDVPRLSSEEQAFMDNQVNTLCQMINDWEIIQKNDLPKQVWTYIKKEKFWGLIIDKAHGGLGFSALAHSTIVTKIASRSLSVALTVMVPNSLGPAEFIMRFGSEHQKEYYLPRLAIGEEVACFALTGLHAGSDATSITDTGIVCRGHYEGKEVLGIRLNWYKRYITLAPVATILGLAFKCYDPDHLLSQQENLGITIAMVPTNLAGVQIGQRHQPLHLAFMNGPTAGKDVFIPMDFIFGGSEKLGQGWQMMMECLSVGRGISLPALSVAVTQVSCRTSSAYAVIRRQFNRSIGDFEGIQQKLAEITGLTYLSNAVRLFTAQAVDADVRPAVASAITKYHLTEIAREVINLAMDVHAGRAIQMGPANYLSTLYCAAPVSITVEGANILTRNLIIFGQGVLRCHPYLREEIEAATDEQDKNKTKFDRLLLAHAGMILSNLVKTFWQGLTAGRLIKVHQSSELGYYYQQLQRMSAAFMLVTDTALVVLGKEIKIKESMSARLGDIVSHLYLATALVKYFSDRGEPDNEKIIVLWGMQYCMQRIGKAMHVIFANFPKKWIGKMLRVLVFPWGNSYRVPLDSLNDAIANTIQKDNALRQQLTEECFYQAVTTDPIGKVELAYQTFIDSQQILQKMQQALKNKQIEGVSHDWAALAKISAKAKVISESEAEQIMQLMHLLDEAIMVDDFPLK